MLPQVVYEMIAVGYLRGMRQRPLCRICIGAGPIAADDFNFLVTSEPRQDRFSRAIWQESEGLARLDVDENGSIAVPTFHREVIYAYHADRRLGRGRDRAEVAQEGRGLHFHPESGSQSLIHLSTGCQPQGFQLFQQAVAHPCPGLDEIRKPFSKHLSLAAGLAAKELAHTKPQDDAPTPARHIVDGALILTVDMV